MPEGLEIVAASVSRGTLCVSGRQWTAELGSDLGSTPATISLVVTASMTGTFTHVVEMGGWFRDPLLQDNSVRLTHEIVEPPAPAFKITSVEVSAGNPTLTWEAVAGRTYRVQWKLNLDDPAWTDLPGDVTASGATAAKTDTTAAGAAQRYYRVVRLLSL